MNLKSTDLTFYVLAPNPENCTVKLRIADPSTVDSQDLGLFTSGDLEAISLSSSKSKLSTILCQDFRKREELK
jgi:hypothetical protein